MALQFHNKTTLVLPKLLIAVNRVTAQLINVQTGSHVWAERYDRELEDVFSVQDEIVRRVVTSIEPQLQAEALDLAKRKPPDDMRAYDYYLRAKSLIDTAQGKGELEQARGYCDSAIELDPSFARAHVFKAISHMIEIYLMEAESLDATRRKAMESAERAVALDPMDGGCHITLGTAAIHLKQYDRARDHVARARELSPNDADVLAESGFIDAVTGDPAAGLQFMGMALERNPRNPSWYHWSKGIILFLGGRFEEALRALNLYSPPNLNFLLWRSATLAQLGRTDEANADVQAVLAIRPGATVTKVMQSFNQLRNPDQFLESLRLAGLPD